MSPLVTPLHWQMVACAGIVVGDCARLGGRAAGSSSPARSAGSGACRSNSWVSVPAARVSPSRIAPGQPAVPHHQLLVDAAGMIGNQTLPISPRRRPGPRRSLAAHGLDRAVASAERGQLDAGGLEPGHGREPL